MRYVAVILSCIAVGFLWKDFSLSWDECRLLSRLLTVLSLPLIWFLLRNRLKRINGAKFRCLGYSSLLAAPILTHLLTIYLMNTFCCICGFPHQSL